jgi:hypothetical protein
MELVIRLNELADRFNVAASSYAEGNLFFNVLNSCVVYVILLYFTSCLHSHCSESAYQRLRSLRKCSFSATEFTSTL